MHEKINSFVLRPFQKEALSRLRSQKHLVCISATGSGKSLVYESFIAESSLRTILITPLIALGRQQYARLEKLFPGEVKFGMSGGEAPDEKTRIWITSPERLLLSQDSLKWKPHFFVVDEAHCLFEWGETFRPSYQGLFSYFNKTVPTHSLWLTATLTSEDQEKLLQFLPAHSEQLGTFRLPRELQIEKINLSWPKRMEWMISFLKSSSEAGIIQVATRNEAERISRLLHSLDKKVFFYHAGLSKEERLLIEKEILREKVDVVVSTCAFGMGMDFSHLKWTLIWQPMSSLLSLAQAVGRVGRFQQKGKAILFWDEADFISVQARLSVGVRERNAFEKVRLFYRDAGDSKVALERLF